MKITIECLGASQRWCGSAEVELVLDEPATVKTAIDTLAQRYPEFAARRQNIAVAIGSKVVNLECTLNPGDRLALIPPVSGG